MVLTVVSQSVQLTYVSQMRSLYYWKTQNKTTRLGTAILQLQTFCLEALSWLQRSERKLLLSFHLGKGFKLITFQSKSILCVWEVEDA